MRKHLTLMNFVDSYQVTNNETFFTNELEWILRQCGYRPRNPLFISYAYAGNDFKTYFQEIVRITSAAGISNLTDVESDDPLRLISNADFIIVGGGDLNRLIERLNRLNNSHFNAYEMIRRLVENGVPYVAWNEGCEISSKVCIKPGTQPNRTGFEIAPHPVICNFENNALNKSEIKRFLLSNPDICRVICQVQRPRETTTVRLEDVGTGLIDSVIGNPSLVITCIIQNGQLIVI